MDIAKTLQQARDAENQGSLTGAIILAESVLRVDSRNVEALVMMGNLSVQQGKNDSAINYFQTALAVDRKCHEALVGFAGLLLSSGQVDLAVPLAERAVQAHPNEFMGYAILGRARLMRRNPAHAIPYLNQAIALEPNQSALYHLLSQALQQTDRLPEAMAALNKAIELAPETPDLYIALGQLYIRQEKRAEGGRCFRKAFELEPDTARGRLQLAKSFIEEGYHEHAEQAVRQALVFDPKAAVAYSLLGQVLQQLGRFDDAATAFEQAIAIQPKSPRTYLHYVKCRKITIAERAILDRMRSFLAEPRLGPDEKRTVHYALGKAMDDLGDYAGAIKHFDEANRIMAQMARPHFDPQIHSQQIDRTIEKVDRKFLADHRSLGSESELPVLIVGMIRSGTTLVEQILTSHPQTGAGGELMFWHQNTSKMLDEARSALDPSKASGIAEKYLETLKSLFPEKLRVTDKMPLNFMFLGAIHLALPKARIIHCRRNPLDTALSMYVTPFPSPVNFAHSRSNIVFYYREYQRLMAHWREVLPEDRFLEVDYEDLVANREGLTRKMVQFLGLDWDDACLHPEFNDRAVKTPSMWQVRQPVYRTSIERWRNYEPWLGELAELRSA